MNPALALHAGVASRDVHLDLEVPTGTVVALLGANGAGKSTAIALAAGTLRPSEGTVRIAGQEVAAAGTWVAPHRRHISLLPQEPLLLPHLDVVANVAFGPRSRGHSRARAAEIAREHLAEVGADHLAHRRPRQLSGGQQQRVALARALAAQPRLLLLDEPLAALDVDAAAELRQVLRTSVRDTGRSAVVVTHELLDVLALADVVVVLEDGRVAEEGPALEVLTRPRSDFAARFAGVNLVLGARLGSDAIRAGDGVVLLGLADGAGRAGGASWADGASRMSGTSRADGASRADSASRASGTGAAAFSPRAVAVHREPPGGSPRNAVAVTVVGIEQQGELVRVRGRAAAGTLLAADITASSVARLGLTLGQDVTFVVKAAEVRIYPA